MVADYLAVSSFQFERSRFCHPLFRPPIPVSRSVLLLASTFALSIQLFFSLTYLSISFLRACLYFLALFLSPLKCSLQAPHAQRSSTSSMNAIASLRPQSPELPPRNLSISTCPNALFKKISLNNNKGINHNDSNNHNNRNNNSIPNSSSNGSSSNNSKNNSNSNNNNSKSDDNNTPVNADFAAKSPFPSSLLFDEREEHVSHEAITSTDQSLFVFTIEDTGCGVSQVMPI